MLVETTPCQSLHVLLRQCIEANYNRQTRSLSVTAELLVYRLVVHLHHDHLVTTVLLSHSLTNIHKQHFHIIKYL